MRPLRWCWLALLPLLGGPALSADDKAEVSLKVVKYGELGDLVKKSKGKVVVVDLWALT